MIDVSSSHTVGRIKIKTYEIATGPLHHDYAFESSAGRLFFDIKMSQIVKMSLKPLEIVCKFKEPLSAPIYSYNFNVVVK